MELDPLSTYPPIPTWRWVSSVVKLTADRVEKREEKKKKKKKEKKENPKLTLVLQHYEKRVRTQSWKTRH
jgi:hypothetical protein